MKNLSLILNGVLIIAVGILFYQVSTIKNGNHVTEELATTDTSSAKKVVINEIGPTNLADAKIAFLNIDSINSQYLYVADYSKKMKGQVQSIENQLENLSVKFQNDLEAYQQSAQAGIAPQAELQKMEEALRFKDQEIKNKQLQLQNLQYDQQDKIIELNQKLQETVDKYNNGRFDYIMSYSESLPLLVFKNKKLDISNDIIKLLNDEYKATKAKK